MAARVGFWGTKNIRFFRSLFKNTGPRPQISIISSSYATTPTRPEYDTEINTENLFTEQHNELRRSINKIITTEINPYVDEWEAKKDFPAHKVFKLFGDAGLLGVTKPTEYGGLGLDYSYSMAIAEELGNIRCGGIPMALGVQMDMATPALTRFGSDELRAKYLVPAIAGDMVTCIGVSEPEAGSDVASINSTAVKDGDDYVINGTKRWITNSFQADWMCMLCNTGDGPMHKNKSLIIVPMDTPGVHRVRKIDTMGMYCSDTGEIHFEDVRVPQSNLIGEEGLGFMYQMLQFQEERMYGTAITLMAMDKAIQDTIDYTRERKMFGKQLLDHQVVHFRLAELKTEVEALRSLLYRATGKYVHGQDVTMLASMCKLKAGRLSREVSDSCLQYWGGMGYTNEVDISRTFRDMRLVSIGGGADEVMLSIICKFMSTLPKHG